MSQALLKRSLAAVTLLTAGFATAIITWSVRTKPCRDFEARAKTVALSLPKDRSRTAEEQAEVKKLIEQACLTELRRCNFRVCSERSTLALLKPQEPESGVQSVAPTTQDAPPLPSPPSLPSSPNLSWLDGELSCDGFLREIQERYPSIGRFAELDPDTQNELKTILRVACSERFQRCRFAACQPVANSPGQ